MRFFFERYYNSECQVTNRLIFILWFFVVWGHLFKPRFKPTLAMNASISVVCYKSKTLSNGEHPLMFRISKDDLCKK